MNNWQAELDAEFEGAMQSRIKKNEGRARVCARRAAGIAIRETLQRRGIRPSSNSAYDLLSLLMQEARLPPDLMEAVDHLTMRVTEEFKLPVDADLIEDARSLCRWLLPDWEQKHP
jgi:HEPN domain-containing protein